MSYLCLLGSVHDSSESIAADNVSIERVMEGLRNVPKQHHVFHDMRTWIDLAESRSVNDRTLRSQMHRLLSQGTMARVQETDNRLATQREAIFKDQEEYKSPERGSKRQRVPRQLFSPAQEETQNKRLAAQTRRLAAQRGRTNQMRKKFEDYKFRHK